MTVRHRVGIGYDAHRFGEGRRLVLGGIEIEGESGLAGHSDADVVTHVVVDALLGAAGLGDIGRHFPDDDPRYRDAGASSCWRRSTGCLAFPVPPSTSSPSRCESSPEVRSRPSSHSNLSHRPK
ncbi:hypothetical protein LCGC14_3052840, partial [marine sediment metagenome]